MKRGNWTVLIIVFIIFLSILILNKSEPQISEEVVKCIGENSVLYVQLGCHACESQEELFGGNSKYLNTIDCFFEKENCPDITATPTWIIKNERYVGVQTVEKLKVLTDC